MKSCFPGFGSRRDHSNYFFFPRPIIRATLVWVFFPERLRDGHFTIERAGGAEKKKEIYCIFSNTPAGSIRFSLELAIFPSFSPSPPFIFLLPSVWRRLSSIFPAKKMKKEGKLERKPHHSSDRRTEKNGNKQEHYKQTISWSGEEAAGRHTH